jgi:membrane protein DedA with SNARE-associated domain
MSGFFSHLFATYGYWFVAGIVGIERLGIPVPGETALIFAGAFAATSHRMSIGLIVAAACAATIIGNFAGYCLGSRLGCWLLYRHGHLVGLSKGRIKIGQYLFLRHGTKLVLFGQFLPVLRELAAFLAGANKVSWQPFMIANAAGAILWSGIFGFGAYLLGKGAAHTAKSLEIGLGIIAAAACVAIFVYLRRNEQRLQGEAEKALARAPGRGQNVAKPRLAT